MRRQAKAPSAGSNTCQATSLRRHGIAFVCLLALLAFSGIGASSTMADESRVPESFSPLTGTGSGVTITAPGGVVIDETTGSVFLNDGSSGGSVTDILNGTSNSSSPVGLVPPYQLTGFDFASGSNGIAFDNSATSPNKGTLYVVTSGGSSTTLKIKKFTRNALTEKFEPAGELTATPGSAPGSTGFFETGTNAAATVDANGNLYVGEFTCRCVVKFNPAGTQVALYNWPGFPTIRPNGGLAVDGAGNLFVAQGNGGPVFTFPATGSGEIVRPPITNILDLGATALALDATRSKLYIALGNRVAQYNVTNPTVPTKDFEFGNATLSATTRLAVNSATDRVYASDNGGGKENVAVFGPPIVLPSATTKAPSGVTGTKATLNGIVNPHGNAITECKFEYGPTTSYGSTVPCEGSTPTDSADHSVSAPISGLTPDGTTYHFRLVVESVNGPASPQGTDRTLVTGNTILTEAATSISASSATLNGFVKPEGKQLTACEFEYGTATDYGQSVPCSPAAATIADDFDTHAVSGALTGLEPNTTYHFRLSKTNADGTVVGQDRFFTTFGPPQLLEQRPIDATQTEVTLQAKIDPSGSPTTYHFEFGTDTSYGIRIPADHDLFAGTGTEPVIVYANPTGLQEHSVYHFRVIATNFHGTTVGPDQRIETLNAAGLPDTRGFELVTPSDKGTSGLVSSDASGQQAAQASVDGQSFIYPLMNGLPDSTAGGWLRQRAERTTSGWLSTQLSGPSLLSPPKKDDAQIAMPSILEYIAPDNSCGFIESFNPLTADVPETDVELGVTNLYRWNADGSYDLVTSQLPLNPAFISKSSYYTQLDASEDCSRVFFKTQYQFIPGASGLYEWDEGTLRDAGVLPNGVAGAGVVLGGEVDLRGTDRWNAVSTDGSRVFFTATSNQGGDVGKPAIFMREDGGASVVDVSQSQTAVPANGARFEAASLDGQRVFFRANYGIAPTTSSGPTNSACGPRNGETEFVSEPKLEPKACDLYVYDITKPVGQRLTDLSADTADPAGAQIQGTIAVDEDGSHVYFAALGQLIPGKGRTYAENTAGFGSANVYLARDGQPLTYVTTLAEHGRPAPGKAQTGDLLGPSQTGAGPGAALMRRPEKWVSATTPDGDELLFVSSLNLTGWDSGGIDKYAAYLYSASTGRISCISCRPDGLPSIALPERPLPNGFTGAPQSSWLLAAQDPGSLSSQAYRPHSLSENGDRILFSSPDVLATGAEAGRRNVYEWQEGQVFFLATADGAGANGLRGYQGMSASGNDVFLASGEQLVPQDTDSVSDVYDIRVGGGFSPPVSPPSCQVDETVPLLPGQSYCQGEPTSQSPSAAAASSGFQGAGNPPVAKQTRKCPAGKVRRRGRCLKPRSHRHQQKRSHERAAKTDTGGAR